MSVYIYTHAYIYYKEGHMRTQTKDAALWGKGNQQKYISSKKCSSFSVQATLLHEFDCSRFDVSTVVAAARFTMVVVFVVLSVCCSLIGWYCEDLKKKKKRNNCSASQVDGFLLAFVLYEEKPW